MLNSVHSPGGILRAQTSTVMMSCHKHLFISEIVVGANGKLPAVSNNDEFSSDLDVEDKKEQGERISWPTTHRICGCHKN